MPLYYGLWAFRQVPQGRFVDVGTTDADLPMLRAYGVRSDSGALSLVLVNIQDPASTTSTTDAVTVQLPTRYLRGHALTLASGDPAGLASLDVSRISLGGQRVDGSGEATGTPHGDPVAVHGTTATVDVAPGTARIVTLEPAP
jgi:hypothetical protein